MRYQKAKGTEDFYPEEQSVKIKLFTRFRSVAESYGFQEVETPAFEDLKLLTAKSGEEIKQQIFTLEKRGNEELGLRFDITVPCARMFMQKQKEIAKPVKWFYNTRMWRYERPQAGRMREFYQFGVEIFGSESPAATAEVINLAVDFLKSLGLTKKDFFVKLNNRNLLQGILMEFTGGKRMAEVIRLIDKKEKLSPADFDAALNDAGIKDVTHLKQILDIDSLDKLGKIKTNELIEDGLQEIKAVYELLDKDFVKIDLYTARGLAYYTGTVFEIFDTRQKFRAICGGGRYDDLIAQFGGEKTSATGFGMGLSTLLLLLKEKNQVPMPDFSPDYFVAVVSDAQRKEATEIASLLRRKGSVYTDIMGKGLSKQISFANSIGAKNLVVVGEEEVKKKQVKIKDMVSGKEKTVKTNSL